MSTHTTAAGALGWTVLAVMLAALVYASLTGDFWREGAALMSMPWGQVTLLETYLGYALFGAWVLRRERRAVLAVAWIVALCSLGHVVSGVYLVRAAARASDAHDFWMGDKA